jgi:hypothetical protein
MEHLNKTGYSYFSHLSRGLRLSLRCLVVSFRLFVHAFLPSVWEDTGWQDLGKD